MAAATLALITTAPVGYVGHLRMARLAPRARSTTMLGVLELKSELLDVLATVPARGAEDRELGYNQKQPDFIGRVLGLVADLEPYDPAEDEGGWMQSDSLAGNWRLLYTSSNTFRRNQGLSGYAGLLEGVETPELLMRVDADPLLQTLTYEEPLRGGAQSVARYVRCPEGEVPERVVVECTWAVGQGDVRLARVERETMCTKCARVAALGIDSTRPDLISPSLPCVAQMMKVSARKIIVGSREWDVVDRRDTDEVRAATQPTPTPATRSVERPPTPAAARAQVDFEQDKAIRVLAACRPAFLDESLFVLRAQIPDVVFIFERA